MNIVFVISFLFFIVKVSAVTGPCVTETDCPSGYSCLQSESRCFKLNVCAGLAPGTNVGSEIGGACPPGSTPDENRNCICQPNQCAGLAPGTNLGCEIGGACPPGSKPDGAGNCIC